MKGCGGASCDGWYVFQMESVFVAASAPVCEEPPRELCQAEKVAEP